MMTAWSSQASDQGCLTAYAPPPGPKYRHTTHTR